MNTKEFRDGLIWAANPQAYRWREQQQRAADGERLTFTKRGKVTAGLVPIADYEWLEANHPVVLKKQSVGSQIVDGAVVAMGGPQALMFREASNGKRTPVARGRKATPVVAVVSPGDLTLLQGRGVS